MSKMPNQSTDLPKQSQSLGKSLAAHLSAIASAFRGTQQALNTFNEFVENEVMKAVDADTANEPFVHDGFVLLDEPASNGVPHDAAATPTAEGAAADTAIAVSAPSSPSVTADAASLVAPTATYHAPIPADQRYYSIIAGRNPGVYRGVHNVAPNVTGIPGASVGRHSSRADAEAAFQDALVLGIVYQIEVVVNRTLLKVDSPYATLPPV